MPAEATVALMQPTFIPWLGYFALIESVDRFVFLDDFQFCRATWGQRNRLFDGTRAAWVTLPVFHSGVMASYCDVRPAVDGFADKLVARLRRSYARAPYLSLVVEHVQACFEAPGPDLASVNIAFIARTARLIGLSAAFERSSVLGSTGKRSARVADILRRAGARTYHAASGSARYMVEDGVFPLADVETRFQDFVPTPYAQVQTTDFVSHLSVLDAMLQVGIAGTAAAIRAGARAFRSWDDATAALDEKARVPDGAIRDEFSSREAVA
jgi:hypothetical protein